MLSEYIGAAMRRAMYEILSDDGSYYGEIPGFQAVWANTDTLDECRAELEEILGEWILLQVADHLPLPPAGQVRLRLRYLKKPSRVA